MNKTLLIVICDFLLLSMLGMISFEDLDTKQEQSSDDLLVASYADSQLVDLLKMSLDKERENRDALSSKAQEVENISKEQALELAKKQEELEALELQKAQALSLAEQEKIEKENLSQENAKALAEAKSLEEKLQNEILVKESLESDKAKSIENAKNLEAKLGNESKKKLELEEKLGVMTQSDAYLKARLESMQAELETAKANADTLKKENEDFQKQAKDLSTQLEVEKTKATIFQEDLERTQSLVLLEKTEKQQIQEHAQSLAKGVDKLADSQEKLSKQVEDMRPLTESEIYESYKANALNIDISYRRSASSSATELSTLRSAIVDINGEYWALFSVEGTPFDRAKNKFIAPESLEISPWAKGLKFNLPSLYSLKYHSNILAFRVPTAFVEQTNLKVYSRGENPFKHEEATIIDTKDLYYGQLKYSVDEKYSGFAKVDSSFFSSILGEFSPSAGDLVFDRSGNFLGIMTTSSNLSLVRNFAVSAPLFLSSKYTKDSARNFFNNMKAAK